MNIAKKITLVSKTYTYDDIGQPIVSESYKYPFAWVRSASRREVDEALDGIAREYVFDVRISEYGGEDEIEYKGIRYTIYRTYMNTVSGIMELYTERRVGS